MKIQEDHDGFERQDGPQTTSAKIKDIFEFEVNEEYDGGDGEAAADDGFKAEGAQKHLTGADR
jgi:hypothetical protein